MNDLKALEMADRLQTLGIEVRSAELRETSKRFRAFAENGNRELRRRKTRAQRKRGRGVTR